MKTIVAMFDNMSEAQSALQDLTKIGIARDDISLVAGDQEGRYASTLPRDADSTDHGSATAGGAVTGAALGGIGGVLLGVGALAIPGIGPVIAAGPLLAGLVGAGIGAAVGGLVGALVDAGVPEEHAGYYAEGVRRGSTLLTVGAPESRVNEVIRTLNQYNPVNIDERAATWRQSGWTGFDANGDVYRSSDTHSTTPDRAISRNLAMDTTHHTPNQVGYGPAKTERNFAVAEEDRRTGVRNQPLNRVDYDEYSAFDSIFRTDYQTRYANSGYTYEQYEPAYRYGYTLANDTRYRDRDWNTIENDARTYWAQNYQDSPWQDFKDAVRHSWQRAKDAVAGRN